MPRSRNPTSKPKSKSTARPKKSKSATFPPTSADAEPRWVLEPWPVVRGEWGPEWAIAVFRSRDGADGPKLWLLVARSRYEGVLYSLRWGNDRKLVSGGPKGWIIRRDRDTATGSGEYHYHCEKDGEEYAIKADGSGSHDTKSGTALPQKLGDFLHDELEIPLNKSGGAYIVHLLPAWTWDSDIQRFAVGIVEAALNADLVDSSPPSQ